MSEKCKIGDLIFSLEGQINRLILGRLKEKGIHDLAPTHGRILMYLHEKSLDSSFSPMNELARHICRKKNTVTALVRKLMERECVETCRSTTDNRVILVKITEKGEGIRKTFEEIFDKIETKCRGKMKDKKIKGLKERLSIVLENLERDE